MKEIQDNKIFDQSFFAESFESAMETGSVKMIGTHLKILSKETYKKIIENGYLKSAKDNRSDITKVFITHGINDEVKNREVFKHFIHHENVEMLGHLIALVTSGEWKLSGKYYKYFMYEAVQQGLLKVLNHFWDSQSNLNNEYCLLSAFLYKKPKVIEFLIEKGVRLSPNSGYLHKKGEHKLIDEIFQKENLKLLKTYI